MLSLAFVCFCLVLFFHLLFSSSQLSLLSSSISLQEAFSLPGCIRSIFLIALITLYGNHFCLCTFWIWQVLFFLYVQVRVFNTSWALTLWEFSESFGPFPLMRHIHTQFSTSFSPPDDLAKNPWFKVSLSSLGLGCVLLWLSLYILRPVFPFYLCFVALWVSVWA